MASRVIHLLLVFAVGCGAQETTPDHLLYSQALEKGPQTASDRLELCNQLSNPPARGDCAANVVQLAARTRHAEPETLCAEVEEGAWRAECYFQMAEHWRRKKNKKRAVENCAQSGPFKNDCEQHLWQGEVRALTRPNGGSPLEPDNFESILPRADLLFEEWRSLLKFEDSASSDFDARFWRVIFQQVLETIPGVDLKHCEPLGQFHKRHCRMASAHLYLRRLQQFLPRGGGIQRFCALPEEDLSRVMSGALGPVGLEAQPDEVLMDVLQRSYEHVCVRKDPLPVSSDWLLLPRSD